MTALTLDAARRFPAKTFECAPHVFALGISVKQHGLIAAYVLLEVLKTLRFPAKGRLFPEALQSLAGLHDIGKVNPLFLRKLLNALPETDPIRCDWEAYLADLPKGLVEKGHWYGSYQTVRSLTKSRADAEIVGRHHDVWVRSLVPINDRDAALGGPEWAAVRRALAEEIVEQLTGGVIPKPTDDEEALEAQKQAWQGLIVLADWIASQVEQPVEAGTEQAMAQRLVKEAGFLPVEMADDLSFEKVFSFAPRPAQASFLALYAGPGVYVLEAPTGYGKTEAALGLACRALQAGDASGVYFALPTQLTSNRIYDRFRSFVASISPQGRGVALIHSGARLMKVKMGKEAEPGGTWFSTNRRALLSPFAVGTVDQALLSELPVRFGCLRAAGLLGKVVIFDEVHSYDAYTSTLLASLIERLKNLGAVVVVLSATLTHAAKAKLLHLEPDAQARESSPIVFTRIAAGTAEAATSSLPLRAEDQHPVHVTLLENDEAQEAFKEAVRRAEAGQQVLWIENTVDEAQQAFAAFQAQGCEAGLLHSRFRFIDRTKLEEQWTSCFGKAGKAKRSEAGRILVGTQVLEQSLDLDADFLVTRLAPMDLLVQRMGRLWRHQDTQRPAGCSRAEAWVLAAPEKRSRFNAETPAANQFGISGLVYPPYVLYRTLEVLRLQIQKSTDLALPSAVRELLEAVYEEREESNPEIASMKTEFADAAQKLSDTALGALASASSVSDDLTEPSTRYMTRPNYESLILDAEEAQAPAVKSGAELSIWLEERLVKSPVPLKGVSDGNDAAVPLCAEIRNFLEKSKRFRAVSCLLRQKDGSLHALDGSDISAWRYDEHLGLCRTGLATN